MGFMIYTINKLIDRHKIGNHYTWNIIFRHPSTIDIFASNNCEIYESTGKFVTQRFIKGNIQDIIASYNLVIEELNKARVGSTGPSFSQAYDKQT